MNYRFILESIYQFHNPEKLGKIDALLLKYSGSEQHLLEAVYKKYSLTALEIEQLELNINPFLKEVRDIVVETPTEKLSPEKNMQNEEGKTTKSHRTMWLYGVVAIAAVVMIVVFALPKNSQNPSSGSGKGGDSTSSDQTTVHEDPYYLSFEGMMGNAGTIVMSLYVNKDDINGFYIYKSIGSKITVKGEYSDNHIFLNEFNTQNQIIATFDGELNGNDWFDGTWIRKQDAKTIDYQLKCIYSNRENSDLADGADCLISSWKGKYHSTEYNYDAGGDMELVITKAANGRIEGIQNDADYQNLKVFGLYQILDTTGVVEESGDNFERYRLILFQPSGNINGFYDLSYANSYEAVAISGFWQKYNSTQKLFISLDMRAPTDYGI